jgi:hypothetical protein
MQQIEVVAWAVPPGSKKNTRPVQLVRSLQSLGALSPSTRFIFHGRSATTAEARSAGVWLPSAAVSAQRRAAAVLSPVFGPQSIRDCVWADFYDDWSLAPDINPWHRHLAARSYGAAREGNAGHVTANSVYMALKTGTPLSHVVPNGVDPAISHLPRLGDDRRRLIVLGHFFKGRTDFDALKSMLFSTLFEEVIIGGPGNDPKMLELINEAKASSPQIIKIVDWLNPSSLAALVGNRTVALIPHVVSDYTLSQDMMKVYTYLSLGMRVICPRLLWPAHLAPEHALLYDFGMSVADVVPEWLEELGPDDEWRLRFGDDNSWDNRAARVLQLFVGTNA